MISDNAKYWIWFTQAIGYTTPKAKMLTELYSDISVFYHGGEHEWHLCGLFSSYDIDKLKSVSWNRVDFIVKRCEELGYDVISIEDDRYPECLHNIFDPPAVLYVDGTFPDIDNRFSIGVVGTRRASLYARNNSYRFGFALAKYGVTIVSGGALGVDCASHRGALAAGGLTICVRGCGINSNYLKDNAEMRRAITKRGAVISEYPPDEEPKGYYFPARNRIIAALSDGVLIIESGVRSGSLITANYALDMGKEVFALLGNNSASNEGSNKRIKEGSAIPVTDFMDILTSYNNLEITAEDINVDDISMADIEAIPYKGMPRKRSNKKETGSAPKKPEAVKYKKDKIDKQTKNHPEKSGPKAKAVLNSTEKTIYDYMSYEPVHIDDISDNLGIPVFKVLSTLTMLEMKGLVKPLKGRYFVLK